MSDVTIDQQFIEYVVKSLVSNPDAVSIERIIDEKGVLLTLTVDPVDLGRVIGKRGATAQSLRTLLRALGTKNEARYNLKIFDNGVPREEREEREDYSDRREDNHQETASSSTGDGWNSGAEDSASATQEKTAERDDSSDESDSIARTRRELEDLDDLDI